MKMITKSPNINTFKTFASALVICAVFAAFFAFGVSSLKAETFEDDFFSYEQTVEEGRDMTVDNEIVYVQNDLRVEYGAELTFNGDCYVEDHIYVEEGGVLTINNELINAGHIYLEDGATLNINGNLINNGDVNNYGVINVYGTYVNYAILNNYNTVFVNYDASIANTGDVCGNGVFKLSGDFENKGSYLAGPILNESELINKGSILIEDTYISNMGTLKNSKDGRISLVRSSFFNGSTEAVLNNDGVFDSTNKSSIYNQGSVKVFENGHLSVLDFYNYSKVENSGVFEISGAFDSKAGELLNLGSLNNLGSMSFTYYSDFEQSKDSSYIGNMYECVYSYGAAAVFNGSVTGYVVVSLASIAATIVVIRIYLVEKAKNVSKED